MAEDKQDKSIPLPTAPPWEHLLGKGAYGELRPPGFGHMATKPAGTALTWRDLSWGARGSLSTSSCCSWQGLRDTSQHQGTRRGLLAQGCGDAGMEHGTAAQRQGIKLYLSVESSVCPWNRPFPRPQLGS